MKLWLYSLNLVSLVGCTITVPNVRVCAVTGTMSAGADCAYSISGETEEMTLDQWFSFLEPQTEPPRGAAMCMSSADFSKIKTAIEQACRKLGTSCTKEAKENLQKVSATVDQLQERVRKKRTKPKRGER